MPNEPMIFFNVGWMKRYKGITDDERPLGRSACLEGVTAVRVYPHGISTPVTRSGHYRMVWRCDPPARLLGCGPKL